MHFEDEVAIVVERFDRVRTAEGLRRVHQEDICQALSVPPVRKYENGGGPGIPQVVTLLSTYSSKPVEDVATYSVAYNWLIAGTDAHGKNYALLIGAGGRVRLAPLYDIASVLPYTDIDIERVKLAMKIGNEYRLRNIREFHWRKLAERLHSDPDRMIDRVRNLAEQLGDRISDVQKRMIAEGLTHPIIPRFADKLTERVVACRRMLSHVPNAN